MKLNEKIQYLRKQYNLTQQELADKLNVSRQAVQKWETGLTSPDLYKMPELANIFNTTIDNLLDENIELNDLITSKDNTTEVVKNKTYRSVLDYLLILPVIVMVFIGLVMFYIIGSIIVGKILVLPFAEVLSSIALLVYLVQGVSKGAFFLLVTGATAIGLIVLVYPTFLLAKYLLNEYKIALKYVNKKIKEFDIKKYL